MAVKIVRQLKSIALLGAPTSAATLAAGPELAPQALRAAGLVDRLTAAGFTVTDHGDIAVRAFQPDDEHPRVRGGERVLAGLEELRTKMEIAVKTGALPVVLGGDNTVVLATIAGVRRYYRDVSLIYLDKDAGLNEPNTTPSGNVDGMVISHIIGRGAPELVRFWRDPPLLREPMIALFGIDRLDQPEELYLRNSPLRGYTASDVRRMGVAAAAAQAFERVHGAKSEVVLHVDLDVIASEDFAATNLGAPGGLRWEQMRQALAFWAGQKTLAALEISCYNPTLDPDGAAAKRIIDLIVEVLSPRLAPAEAPAESAAPLTPQGGGGGHDVPSPLDATKGGGGSHDVPSPLVHAEGGGGGHDIPSPLEAQQAATTPEPAETPEPVAPAAAADAPATDTPEPDAEPVKDDSQSS